jgi:inorganic phosphate transporter, PiT family
VASGWIVTPVIAGLLCFVSLFFFQNVFNQRTYHPVSYQLTQAALTRIRDAGLPADALGDMIQKDYPDAATFDRALKAHTGLTPPQRRFVLASAKVDPVAVTAGAIDALGPNRLSSAQRRALRTLEGLSFVHPWQLGEALAKLSPAWRPLAGDEARNTRIDRQLAYLYFRLRSDD